MGDHEGLTIGLVGCGRWGSNILRDLIALGCTVDVVIPSTSSAQEILDLGANRVVHEPSALTGVDGVIVATPSSTHADVIDACLALDVPLFVEKPFTTDTDRALGIAQRAPDSVFVMDKWRYHPGVEMLREIVADGRLGPLRSIETIRVQDGMPHSDVDCTWILLPHDLSIALEITGRQPRVTSADARWSAGRVVAVDAGFDLGEGITMHSQFGIDANESRRSIRVIGDDAIATLAGGWEDHVQVHDAHGTSAPIQIPTPGELPLLAELRCFLTHLRGGPAPRTSASDSAAIVRTIAELREMIGAER